MSAQNYGSPITGKLTAATANVPVVGLSYPVSVVLNSAAAGKQIQFSFDGGATFYPAVTPTYTSANQIVYELTIKVTNILFTGAINDTYSLF